MANDALNRNEQIKDINTLLGASLDDLDDLPSFECPPVGVYVVSVSTEMKSVNDNDAIEATYTVVETMEMADNEAKAPVAGSKFSTLFTLNPFGIGKLKEFCMPFGEKFGTNNVGELVNDKIKDVICTVSVKHRKDKEDPEKVYPAVKIQAIA